MGYIISKYKTFLILKKKEEKKDLSMPYEWENKTRTFLRPAWAPGSNT